MKQIIVLLLCLLGSSPLLAQDNTVLGTGALSQGAAPKYAIQEFQITNPGSYSRPTLDFGSFSVQWDYLDIGAYNYGLYMSGAFHTSSYLGDFVPTWVGGHGTGATVGLYLAWEENSIYHYEVYYDDPGTGYAPLVTLSSSTGSAMTTCYINESNQLGIYYYDNDKTNLYETPPTVSISFGGATAIAVLEGTPANGGNTAIGYQALFNNNGGRENTALGHLAGNTLTTGNNNVLIGKNAGKGITTGSGNLFIGNGSNIALNNGLSNSIVVTDGNGTPRIFTGSNGNVKIGYGTNFSDSGFKLDVNGTIRSTSIIQASRISLKDISLVSPNSTFYHDFLLSVFDTNTLQLRSVVDANNYPTVFSVDKPSASMTFYAPVKGVEAVNNNEFVTLGQLSKSHKAVDWITHPGANADLIGENTSSFTYSNNAPYNGYLGHFGNGGYGLQINTSYFGNDLGYRSRNGDSGSWNNWNTFFHSGNMEYVKTALGLPNAGGFDLQGSTARGNTTTNNIIAQSFGIRYSDGNTYQTIGTDHTGLGTLYRSSITGGDVPIHRFQGLSTTDLLTIKNGGNVGIGIDNPQEKLAVNGKIRAKEVKVEPINGWPDYVFEEDYKALSLSEIASFVKTYKHLPEVPSAKEVELNGLELGEMNKILLKKIEELTLHLIEKDKELKTTNGRLDELEKLISKFIGTQKK